MSYEINKVIVFSTAHITLHDSKLLPGLSSCHNYEYGAFVYVPADDRDDRLQDGKFRAFSDAFLNLMRQARNEGCCWLQLDADGPTYDHLPTFEW